MKPLFFILLFSLNAFSQESVEYLREQISMNPDYSFFNQVDHAELKRDINGQPVFSVKKEGYNFSAASFLINATLPFLKTLQFVDDKLAFNKFVLTFNFRSPNGADHSFTCVALDNYNCGILELPKCSKSKFGYTFISSGQDVIYDSAKKEKCDRVDSKINQDEGIKDHHLPKRPKNKKSSTTIPQ
tara:strand:+ start:137 stop:694 length:558 start_codon:yes stop_codon:yes gene_type:complete